MSYRCHHYTSICERLVISFYVYVCYCVYIYIYIYFFSSFCSYICTPYYTCVFGDALVVGKVADGVASAKALEAIVGWFLS